MADPATYRPAPGQIPLDPGVYRFRDKDGRVIYVGKAKSLRPRLSSYFQDLANLHPRTATMVLTGASVEWTVVATEVEALQLEYSWIKEFDPRFNVKYRDDKSYPFLAVTMGEEFPRAQVLRGAKRPGTRYFGPYGHAWAIRETLDLLMRIFPIRTCSTGVFKRAGHIGRPCLLGYIDKCSAPCVGRVDAAEHRAIAEDFCDFMAGATRRFTKRLTTQMQAAAADLDFERAARLRDDIEAMTKALERSAVVFGDATDADVFAIADDELEMAVQVFHVRGGRVRGQRGWVAEKEHEDIPQLVEHLLAAVYGGESAQGVPREVLLPVLPPEPLVVTQWLADLREGKVDLRVPQRGDKRALMDTVQRNAEQSLARHKVSRAGDLTARSQALEELRVGLDLVAAPLRIECFDVSHVQGTNLVASMVAFEDALARKSEYRRFLLQGDGPGTEPTDDTAAMREVLRRRFQRYLNERSESVDGRPRKFSYLPNLLVVDGGLPQANVAADVLADLGVVDVAVVGLAKRLEEVWRPGEEFPIILPRGSEGLYLLQRVRDEAHRFAVTFHRERRSKAMTRSGLDGIPGLGPARQAALRQQFGSVKKVRAASVEELAAVPGIGAALAATIAASLRAPSTPSVNLTTGEVLDD